MLTPSHGLLAWFLGRKLLRSKPETIKFFVLGSVAPDFFMVVYVGVLTAFKYHVFGTGWIFYNIFFNNAIKYPTMVLHSFMWIGLIYLSVIHGAKCFKNNVPKIRAFFTGLVFHSLVDLFTHKDFAHEHFWPLSNFKFGLISDQNPYFLTLDLTLVIVAMGLLLFKTLKTLRNRTPNH